MRNSTPNNTWCRWVVSGVRCFWGCWLMYRYRGMNALQTSVSLVKLLTLSTDPIHSFTVFDQVFQIWRYCYTYMSERLSKGTGTVVSLHCTHARHGTTHPVKWAACPLGMVLGMMISAIKISVHDDWGLFKDELEIGGGKVPHSTRCYPDQIIVVIVRRTRHRQAHVGDSNSAFTNQFLLQTMLLLLSCSRRDGCKDRPNDLFAFGVRRPAKLAALVSQR